MTSSQEKPTLLIVEDDAAFLETLSLEFSEKGYEVFGALSAKAAREYLSRSIRFAILDLRVGADSGIALLKELKAQCTECRAIILTGYGSIATAVQSLREGAFNYLTKPVSIDTIERALWVELEGAESQTDSVPSLARHEREYIEFVLARCQGNISHAAEKLGIHRQSLQRKLRKFPPRV